MQQYADLDFSFAIKKKKINKSGRSTTHNEFYYYYELTTRLQYRNKCHIAYCVLLI